MRVKTCPHCGKQKSAHAFYRRKDGSLRSWCQICSQAASKRWYKKHPKEAGRRAKRWRKENPQKVQHYKRQRAENEYYASLRRKYGIDPVEAARRLKKQNYQCAVCGAAPRQRRLNLDHCHSTGKVRGFLCRRCNSILGFVGDDADLLVRGARYLRKWHGT